MIRLAGWLIWYGAMLLWEGLRTGEWSDPALYDD